MPSLEQSLLFNRSAVTRPEGANMVPMQGETWWDKNIVWAMGVLLALVGAFLVYGSAEWLQGWEPTADLVKAMGEALTVAGVLSVAVDRPLKKRLLQEASRGIFKHMVGFDPQPEIKDELERIVFWDTKVLCRRRNIRIGIEPSDAGMVRVTVDTSVDVETPGATAVTGFQQFAAFERAENPTMHRLSLIAPSDAGQNYDQPNPELRLKPPGILEARMRDVTIKPNSTYQFFSQYSMILPDNFYHAFHVGHPTIGVHISVFAPEDFVVEPDETPNHVGVEYDYPGLFMPGRNVTVRWHRNPC
jgi:hypothetical protein